MTRQMTATQAKAKLLALLDDVEKGEEIEITRHGHTVAKLVPARSGRALLGMLAGIAKTTASEEELFSTGEPWEAQ